MRALTKGVASGTLAVALSLGIVFAAPAARADGWGGHWHGGHGGYYGGRGYYGHGYYGGYRPGWGYGYGYRGYFAPGPYRYGYPYAYPYSYPYAYAPPVIVVP